MPSLADTAWWVRRRNDGCYMRTRGSQAEQVISHERATVAKLQREAAELVRVVERSAAQEAQEAQATSRAQAADGRSAALRDACEAEGRQLAAALDEREQQRCKAEARAEAAEARAEAAEARAEAAEARAAEAEANLVQAAAEYAADVGRRTLEGDSEEVWLDDILVDLLLVEIFMPLTTAAPPPEWLYSWRCTGGERGAVVA
jgi:hypothetical protein